MKPTVGNAGAGRRLGPPAGRWRSEKRRNLRYDRFVYRRERRSRNDTEAVPYRTE